MEPRIDVRKISPDALKAMFGLERFIRSGGLDEKLLTLIRFRVSQVNGCAYCLDMHSKDLRALGETEQRLYMLDAWRESPFYTDRERAALEWAEAVTLVANDHVPDEVFKRVREHFNEDELVTLTMAVVSINAWNRLSISLRAVPGNYQPHQYEELIKKMAA